MEVCAEQRRRGGACLLVVAAASFGAAMINFPATQSTGFTSTHMTRVAQRLNKSPLPAANVPGVLRREPSVTAADRKVGLSAVLSRAQQFWTTSGTAAVLAGVAAFAAAQLLASSGPRSGRKMTSARRYALDATVTPLPTVDRNATKKLRKDFQRSDQYFKFSSAQMRNATKTLKRLSGSELLAKIRENDFRLTVGDITFLLAEANGMCWGVERSVAMAYEARNFFPDNSIWVTNEIVHNPVVNQNLKAMGMNFLPKTAEGGKDFSGVSEGDVVILPAFGASADEMAFLKERNVRIVDTTCPWVSKVWNSVERSKAKGYTSIIHAKYDHEETVATKSFAAKYIAVKNMSEAEYVAKYILGEGDREDFMQKFAKAMSDGFDPDVDLESVGVANQTTMLKGETELIGKLFERVMIKRYGPQEINEHFISFNTICDATQERQDAMYDMFDAKYEAPTSALYTELEGEQVGIDLMTLKNQEKLSSKQIEAATKGGSITEGRESTQRMDIALIVGGFNSSNTIHLLEIAEEEGVPAYHIDCPERIAGPGGVLGNSIQHKPLSTHPQQAMLDEGLEVQESFLPEGPVIVGVTSGASTPDSVVGACLERILELRGVFA